MSDPAPPLPRAAVLGLAVLTVAAVGVLSLALFWGDIVDDPSDPASSAVALGGDDFDRADADGLADADHEWTEPVGTWIVQDGHAATTSGAGNPIAGLAVLPTDEAAARIEVTATAVEPGWGLAFRVQDADDLWAIVARPDRGSWSLLHVDGGTVEETEDFIAIEPTDLSVVHVDLAGDLIRVTINGNKSNEVSDAGLADATDVGLLALPPGNLTSMAWDSLTVSGN